MDEKKQVRTEQQVHSGLEMINNIESGCMCEVVQQQVS
jgi:hypothetical protein